VETTLGGEETDILTVSDFIQRTQGLFSEVGLKHVIAIWVGNQSVYRTTGESDQNNRDEKDNRDEAFAALSIPNITSSGDDKEEEAGLRAHGFGQDFETEFTVTFKRRHPPTNPSITLAILALPIEFSWRSGEEAPERMDRLNQFMNDKAAVISKGQEATAKMKDYLRSLQDKLRQVYDARDVTYGLQVNLDRMIW